MSDDKAQKSADQSAVSAIRDDLRRAEGLIDSGKGAEAGARLDALLAAYPDYFAARTALARQRFTEARYAEALTELERALRLDPDNARLLVRIGQIEKMLGFKASAAARFQQAMSLDPAAEDAVWERAQLDLDDDDLDVAIARLAGLSVSLPFAASVQFRLADAYERVGRPQDATALYERLFTAKDTPTSARNNAAFRLAALPSGIDGDVLMHHLINGVAPEYQMEAEFARADLLIRQHDYSAAWTALLRANQQKWARVEHSVRRQEQSYARILAYCAQAPLDPLDTGEPSQRTNPVLIVGASRSGKTLIEQVLFSLGAVTRGFESDIFPAAVASAARTLQLPPVQDPWFLNPAELPTVHAYGRKAMDKRGRGARWLTLTSPANIFHVGTVAQAFPDAPIIIVRRNRDDLLARIFATNYAGGHAYSYDLASLKRYLIWQEQIADCWVQRLGSRCLVTSYEELVAAPDRVSGALAQRLHAAPVPTRTDLASDVGFGAPFKEWIAAKTGSVPG